MKTGPKPRPTIDRMMEKTVKQADECWIFTGAKGSQGYGKTYHEGKAMDAHRVSWMVFRGVIPNDMCVCHSCDVKACVNPDHLFLGTTKDNLDDMRRKMRHSHGEPHANAIRRGWTPEKRARRALQTGERRRAEERQRRVDAGVPADWKYCGKSKHWLPRNAFTKNRARLDGLNNYCRACRSLRSSNL